MTLSPSPSPSRFRRGLLAGAAALLALPGLALAQGVSNGTAVVTGAEHGKPVIAYEQDAGAAPNNGVTPLAGNADGGARLVPGLGAAGGFADGGIPVFTGQEDGRAPGIAYLEAPAALAAAPAAPARAALAPRPHAPWPAGVPDALRAARADLAGDRLAEGRQRIEQAQTMLLNARREGESGWHRPVQQLESALQALDRHDARSAGQALDALPLPA